MGGARGHKFVNNAFARQRSTDHGHSMLSQHTTESCRSQGMKAYPVASENKTPSLYSRPRVPLYISSTFAFGTNVRVRCMRVAPHPRHAPPGARQGPRRLGCASSPPPELGQRPSRAGRLASGAVRVRCGPLSSVPARHGVRASRCTHATPTSRPPGPWPLLAKPYYCGTDVAEKGSAEGALAAGPLGGPAFRLRACDADGLAGFAWRHELTTLGAYYELPPLVLTMKTVKCAVT